MLELTTSKYFDMGHIVVTNRINETMKESNLFHLEVLLALDILAIKIGEIWTKRTSRPMRMLYNILMIYTY